LTLFFQKSTAFSANFDFVFNIYSLDDKKYYEKHLFNLLYLFNRFFCIWAKSKKSKYCLTRIKSKSISSVKGNIGFFYHKKIESAIYLNGEYNQYFKLHKNIRIGWVGGIGYLHGFYPAEIYELDTNNGEFEKATEFGKSRFTVHTGIGMQFPNGSDLEPFIRQDFMLEFPHSREFGVLPHSLLKIGVTMKLRE